MNNQLSMPRIGAGTFRLQGEQAIDSVANALDLGYRHIDTAQIYGNESEVGQALQDSGVPRGKVFVTTKIWTENLSSVLDRRRRHRSADRRRR